MRMDIYVYVKREKKKYVNNNKICVSEKKLNTNNSKDITTILVD